MSLSDASRALEIVDAHLVAIQSRLAEINADRYTKGIPEIVDQLDLVIGDVRSAAGDVAAHTCSDPFLKEKYDDLVLENRRLGRLIRSGG